VTRAVADGLLAFMVACLLGGVSALLLGGPFWLGASAAGAFWLAADLVRWASTRRIVRRERRR
jgi:hypothetical protein